MRQGNFSERLKTPIIPDSRSLLESDAAVIVNSANNFLRHGSGVARVIADAIPGYQAYCDRYIKERGGKPLKIGSAVITPGFNLQDGEKRQGVIHAVGMGYRRLDQHFELISATTTSVQKAVLNTLRLGKKKNCRSLSLPLMCSRKGGLTREESVLSILSALEVFEKEAADQFAAVYLHCFDELDHEALSLIL